MLRRHLVAAAQGQDAMHQGPSRICWRMMTLILIGGRTVAAHVAPDLAGEFPAGADAADGEGADLLAALFEALAGKGGRREEMGEPPHRLDRAGGRASFRFRSGRGRRLGHSPPQDRAEAVANGLRAAGSIAISPRSIAATSSGAPRRVTNPARRAVSRPPKPATIPPSESIRIGLVKPNSTMLATIDVKMMFLPARRGSAPPRAAVRHLT